MNKVKRNDSIDIARGIAILFVVSWHCRVGNFGITMWVMPLFFFIMGVFYHTPISLKLQIRKKTNQLLIPFVIWSIPYFIYYLFTKSFLAFVKMWLNPYEIMNGPSWFLLCMFECYIIYYGIKKIEVEYRGLLIVFLSIIGFYLGTYQLFGHHLKLPLFINTTLTVIPFIYLGDLLKDRILPEQKTGREIKLSVLLLFLFVMSLYNIGMIPIDMYWNDYRQNYPTFLFNSLVGILLIIGISKFIPTSLAVIGRLSMLILVIHIYFYELLKMFFSHPIVLFVAVSALSIFTAWMIDKYIPYLSGKYKYLKI